MNHNLLNECGFTLTACVVANCCLSFCPFFSFGHCVVCPCLIYWFWLPVWYLQTLLQIKIDNSNSVLFPMISVFLFHFANKVLFFYYLYSIKLMGQMVAVIKMDVLVIIAQHKSCVNFFMKTSGVMVSMFYFRSWVQF